MRVCVVAENHASVMMGGAEYQTLLLTEELARRASLEVTYLARRIPDESAARNLPYAVRRIGTDKGIRRRAVLFDGPELRTALDEIKPDFVYQQMRQSYTAVCASFARRNAIPFFFHIASDQDLDTNWIPHRFSSNLPFDVMEAALGMRGLRMATHVISQSTRQSRMLEDVFGRKASVLLRNFQPLPASLPAKTRDRFRVLWVANFKNVKRPQLFIDLADVFRDRPGIEFQMVGRSSDHRSFVALMNRIEQTPNLRYFGELDIDAVNQLMAQAHVHVNTSSREGFPNTFIQAWAQGAVVCTVTVDPDGSMERDGIGFCSGSVPALAAKVDELFGNESRRADIAHRAFSFVHQHHSMARASDLADLMICTAHEYEQRRRKA